MRKTLNSQWRYASIRRGVGVSRGFVGRKGHNSANFQARNMKLCIEVVINTPTKEVCHLGGVATKGVWPHGYTTTLGSNH